MENKKFEDCPFCGSDKIDIWDKICETGRTVFFAYCTDCRCEGPVADTEKQAIKLWNEREK